MEFDELLISTGVDSLIKLIEERKRIELGMASKLLGLPTATVEDWAHVLEEEKIIRIEYRLTEVNLVWVAPGMEEVKSEKAEFVRKKAALEDELRRLEAVQKKGKDDLRQQAESMEKMYSHFEESFRSLEELSKQIKGVGERRGDVSRQTVDKAEELGKRMKEIRDSAGLLEKQLLEHKKVFEKEGVGRKVEDLESYRRHVTQLEDRVNDVLRRADEAVKRAPKAGKAEITGLEKDMEKLEGEYRKIRDDSTSVKELIDEFRQSAEVLQTVRDLMKNVSESSVSVKGQLEKEYSALEQLKREIPGIEKNLKADLELVAQYEDALKVAHDVMAKLPEKDELIRHVGEIEGREDELVLEFKKFEKNINAVTGNVLSFGDIVAELTKLRDEVEAVSKAMAKDSKEVFSSLEEETTTYNTFQKIKMKTKLSIDQYLSQMEKIKEESETVSAQLESLRKDTNRKLGDVAEAMGSENLRKAVELLDELEEKKKKIEEVRNIILDLNQKSERLEKNIRILMKEADLISLREGGPTPKEAEERTERIRLTATEQDEFEKKRKELKDLIRRLWDVG
ncbi:hypothetical protein H0O01_02230 [Candidatus Micrarchaeota archaeon]|nr:hypothetical protein [Candidatus Micrarchaeota archaeon]